MSVYYSYLFDDVVFSNGIGFMLCDEDGLWAEFRCPLAGKLSFICEVTNDQH